MKDVQEAIYNDIFKTIRIEKPDTIPKEVSKAYDVLSNYVQNNLFYGRLMLSQLMSDVISREYNKIYQVSERKTAPPWLSKHCDMYEKVPNKLRHIPRLIDHDRYLRNRETGEYILISQPYCDFFNTKLMGDLVNLCNELNIECVISPASWHYPCRTILLKFSEKRGEK